LIWASDSDEDFEVELIDDPDRVTIYWFWGEDCPICEEQKRYVDEWEKNDDIEVKRFEIYRNTEDRKVFQKLIDLYDVSIANVPTTFIGDEYWVGFDERIESEIEEAIDNCKESNQCFSPGDRLSNPDLPGSTGVESYNLPIIGEVEGDAHSLVVFTGLIAFVDGLNPCSIWVLSCLLGMMLYSGKKKVFLVGITFLIVTAVAYGLFIAGSLTIFHFISKLFWIRLAVAAFAIFFAAVSIKDFFWFKKGLSFTIPDKYKPKIYMKLRGLIKKEDTLTTITATAAIAAGVAIIELPCTAGFPVIWSQMISERELATTTYASFLILYIIIYLSIELVIYLFAAFQMKRFKFGEIEGRILKFVGGSIMLGLGLVMIIDPTIMHSIRWTLAIFALMILGSLAIAKIYITSGKFSNP